MKKKLLLFGCLSCLLLAQGFSQRTMEWLDRGVQATRQPDGRIFISWRLLGTDPAAITFNVYRLDPKGRPVRINTKPVASSTSFIFANPDTASPQSYFVRPLLKGKEGAASAPFVLRPGASPYVSVPLKTPAGYSPNDASVGDLDGAAQYNCVKNNGTKSNPVLSAEIWGDWREEVIYRTADNNELRIFSTTIPTTHRFYTLMHDPQYRLSIAWQNVAYNQPPHTGFYLGEGMQPPPAPNIRLVARKKASDDHALKQ